MSSCIMSESEQPLPNGRESLSPAPTSAAIPPEIESTLSRLSAYRAVKGVMILSRTSTSADVGPGGGIVQCTGSIFEGEGGQRYARLVEGLVSGATRGVGECDEGVSHLTPIVSGQYEQALISG
jgi:dynein light chain roadblock-type